MHWLFSKVLEFNGTYMIAVLSRILSNRGVISYFKKLLIKVSA